MDRSRVLYANKIAEYQAMRGEQLPQAKAPQGQEQQEQQDEDHPADQVFGRRFLSPSGHGRNLVLINPTHAIEKELEMTFDEVQGYKFDSRIAGKVRELIAAAKDVLEFLHQVAVLGVVVAGDDIHGKAGVVLAGAGGGRPRRVDCPAMAGRISSRCRYRSPAAFQSTSCHQASW